ELGFDGVVISDDMQMDAIRAYFGLETAIEQALLAGIDILSFANNSEYNPDIVPEAHRIIRKLIRDGRITEERIDDSWQRIRTLKLEHL
ncbi:MAG: glycoside hydrolase family 3 N-terminal domain-containing protein, partial [Balneolaceae bacterium]